MLHVYTHVQLACFRFNIVNLAFGLKIAVVVYLILEV